MVDCKVILGFLDLFCLDDETHTIRTTPQKCLPLGYLQRANVSLVFPSSSENFDHATVPPVYPLTLAPDRPGARPRIGEEVVIVFLGIEFQGFERLDEVR